MLFGLVRRRRPYIHSQWYVALADFRSEPETFYQAVEDELREQEVPDMTAERIVLKQGSLLSSGRRYLRLRRERFVIDICSAPFGKAWWFSVRAATLGRSLKGWEVILAVLGLLGFALLEWQLFGPQLGGILFGSSILFLLLVFLTGNLWSGLDEFLVYLPVVGAFYEGFRRDTYYRQDQRLMFGEVVNGLVKDKVREFCMAGGVDEPQFVRVSSPEQILTEREMEKYFGIKKDK
ncbi:MAG: hypothetical protein V4726_15405 [Verrucomicrobiota bacterium]